MKEYRLSDFDYNLPDEFIAQRPSEPRDSARLLHLNRQTEEIHHLIFHDIIQLLNPGDTLVLNDTRVIPARLYAIKTATGGKIEILLLRQLDELTWRGLVGGRGLKKGIQLRLIDSDIHAEVVDVLNRAERIIKFSQPINDYLATIGETPLPPYIHISPEDPERYQTIYSKRPGSAAAPTAGLHFTGGLLNELQRKGIQLAYCTLHIGLDTFKPVEVNDITKHNIHSERAILTAENANIINRAKLAGSRIIAVGTTSARVIETAAILSAGDDPANPDPDQTSGLCPWRPVTTFEGDTYLYIYPGYRWRVIDAIITNFHLPKSTLLMMISAFAGRELILHAYEVAKREGYRFYSFGDAMFIE